MSDISRRKIIQSLKAKGFTETKPKGTHYWYVFEHNGKKYRQIMAKVSRGLGYKTYQEGLWKRMKERLGLDENWQVCDLLNCPLDREGYLEILKQKKIINN